MARYLRDGELEATNYFFAAPGQEEEELELTFNHDGRTTKWARRTAISRSPSTTSMRLWRS